MRVLVAGGAGYIGSVLCRKLLSQNNQVTVLDNLMFGGESLIGLLNNPNFKLVHGDIRSKKDLNIIKNYNAVINLAAIVGENLCLANPKEAIAINQKAACSLADIAKKSGVNKYIFISTCSNYGISEDNKLSTEESPLNPISLYAQTKVASERYILKQSSDGFGVCVLRLSTVFGLSPRMRFDLLINELVKDAFVSGKLTVYKEEAWRPLIHIEDVASAIAKIVKTPSKKINGQIFNIGYNNYQKSAIIKILQKEDSHLKVDIIKDKGDKRNYRVSFAKSKDRLGFEATRTVEFGIKEMLSALKIGVFKNPKDCRFTNIN